MSAPFTIGPREDAGGGIQASHTYDAYHRVIGGTTYRFVQHHHLMSPGCRGIQVYRLEMYAGQIASSTEILSVGDRIPQRSW